MPPKKYDIGDRNSSWVKLIEKRNLDTYVWFMYDVPESKGRYNYEKSTILVTHIPLTSELVDVCPSTRMWMHPLKNK